MDATAIILIIALGGIFTVGLVIRFLFIKRRIRIFHEKTPNQFGTLAPGALHQKVKKKRTHDDEPFVLARKPGAKLGQGIRVEKKSSNFVVHVAKDSRDIDDYVDLEDFEAQPVNNQEAEEEFVVDPNDNYLRVTWYSVLLKCVCPCFVQGTSENTIDDDDDASLDSFSNVELAPMPSEAKHHIGKHSSNLGRNFSEIRKANKKKFPSKAKVLTTKDKVNKFVEHIQQKSMKKKIKKLKENEIQDSNQDSIVSADQMSLGSGDVDEDSFAANDLFPETDDDYFEDLDINKSGDRQDLTVGYHATTSNGNRGFVSPRVNTFCAQQRRLYRARLKENLTNTYGEVDVVELNSGPSPELIPEGFEIVGSLGDMNQIAMQPVMYLFDEDTAVSSSTNGWYFGTLIGPSMRKTGNYHIRFEVKDTGDLKVCGLYKLDLALEGLHAYGRRWVILKPSFQPEMFPVSASLSV